MVGQEDLYDAPDAHDQRQLYGVEWSDEEKHEIYHVERIESHRDEGFMGKVSKWFSDW